MYGLVNTAVEGMVLEAHGPDVWERIRTAAGVDVDVFVSNDGYPDSVTYDLVGAASEVLGVPPDEVLRAFGRYWVLRTAREGYGPLMESNGRTLMEFLLNLPELHTRVVLIFPHLQPPEFEITDVGDEAVTLHYRSDREGLAPFVEGLLDGLGEMFETPVTVTQLAGRGEGADHDVFRVDWSAAA